MFFPRKFADTCRKHCILFPQPSLCIFTSALITLSRTSSFICCLTGLQTTLTQKLTSKKCLKMSDCSKIASMLAVRGIQNLREKTRNRPRSTDLVKELDPLRWDYHVQEIVKSQFSSNQCDKELTALLLELFRFVF